MIRALMFILVLGLIVLGLGWHADQPGDVAVTFAGRHYETSPLIALLALLFAALAIALAFIVIGYFLRLPRRLKIAARARRRRKGFDALSRGMVAASAGDVRSAQRASAEAAKHLGDQPLALLLEAQTAMLAGDRAGAQQSFARMAQIPETRVLALRGLHLEARRRGDMQAAHEYAETAHRLAPLPWAGQAVLEHHAARQDWAKSLEAIDANLARKIIDKAEAKRQRAALKTAFALELGPAESGEALRLASEAVAAAPDLTPASVLAGRLLGRRGDVRKASRVLESAWRLGPHPDIASVYLDLRPGDSSSDRLKRAQTLARLAPDDPESRMVVARAAIAAREFEAAREAMAPLLAAAQDNRPTARMCMVMVDLEEAAGGSSGVVREWLARASRAPRDKAWVADGVVSDSWSPYSPISGKLGVWTWKTPPERLSHAWEPGSAPVMPAITETATEPPRQPPAAASPARPVRTEPPKPSFPLVTAPDDPGPARA